jgi:hypothetical protein
MTTAETNTASPVQAQPMPQSMPIAQGDGNTNLNDSARSAATDFLQIESIVLNLDASLRVHARAHFFSWTQGLLQSLIRHELLVCTLCLGKPPAFRADGFSMTTPDPSTLSDIFLRDTSVAPALLKAWEERRYQPVTWDVTTTPLGSGAFTRELERLGGTQLLVHGVHDADGRALTMFTFACRPGSVGRARPISRSCSRRRCTPRGCARSCSARRPRPTRPPTRACSRCASSTS